MANGSNTNCTTSVGVIIPYMPSFSNNLDIVDQDNNPAGSFNLIQLHDQARQFPNVTTELFIMRDDIRILYYNVFPVRPCPKDLYGQYCDGELTYHC